MLLAMLFALLRMPLHAFIHLPNPSQCSKVTLPTLLGRYVAFLPEDFTWPKPSSEYIPDVYYIVLVSGSSINSVNKGNCVLCLSSSDSPKDSKVPGILLGLK